MNRIIIILAIIGLPFFVAANTPCINEETVEENCTVVSFESIINGEHVDLTWETINENKVTHFTVEKSRDGVLFETLFEMAASEKWSACMDYFNSDFNVWEGKTFYRIKQNDIHGNVLTLQTITVVFNGNDGQKMERQPIEITETTYSLDNLLSKPLDTDKMEEETLIIVRNRKGEELFSKVVVGTQNENFYTASDENNSIPDGKYLVVGSSDNRLFGKKILIRN